MNPLTNAQSVQPHPVTSPRHTVVCVDDDPNVRAALGRALRNEPYTILLTDQPRRVLDWVESLNVSLVIADQRMPDMSGIDLLQCIHLNSPSTLGVLLTAYPEDVPKARRRRSTVRMTLLKPWDTTHLKNVVRRLLGQPRTLPFHPSAQDRN